MPMATPSYLTFVALLALQLMIVHSATFIAGPSRVIVDMSRDPFQLQVNDLHFDPVTKTIVVTTQQHAIYVVHYSWTNAPLTQLLAGKLGVPGDAFGSGHTARFRTPFGLCQLVLHSEKYFVTDKGNHVIRLVTILTGDVGPYAGQVGVRGFTDGLLSQRGGTVPTFGDPAYLAAVNSTSYVVADGKIRLIKAEQDVLTLAPVEFGARCVAALLAADGADIVIYYTNQSVLMRLELSHLTRNVVTSEVIRLGYQVNAMNLDSDSGSLLLVNANNSFIVVFDPVGNTSAVWRSPSSPSSAERGSTTLRSLTPFHATVVVSEPGGITAFGVNASSTAYVLPSSRSPQPSVMMLNTSSTAPEIQPRLTVKAALPFNASSVFGVAYRYDTADRNAHPFLLLAIPSLNGIYKVNLHTFGIALFVGSPNGADGTRDGRGEVVRFKAPSGLIFLAKEDLFLVSERLGHQLRTVAPNGEVHRVAGTGFYGSFDGVGLKAEFNEPDRMLLTRLNTTDYALLIDRGTASLRAVDLKTMKVSTITQFFGDPQAIAASSTHCYISGGTAILFVALTSLIDVGPLPLEQWSILFPLTVSQTSELTAQEISAVGFAMVPSLDDAHPLLLVSTSSLNAVRLLNLSSSTFSEFIGTMGAAPGASVVDGVYPTGRLLEPKGLLPLSENFLVTLSDARLAIATLDGSQLPSPADTILWPSTTHQALSPPSSRSRGIGTTLLVVVMVVPVAVVIVVCIVIFLVLRWKRKKRKEEERHAETPHQLPPQEMLSLPLPRARQQHTPDSMHVTSCDSSENASPSMKGSRSRSSLSPSSPGMGSSLLDVWSQIKPNASTFRQGKLLGRGGFGEVRVGLDGESGRLIAAKLIDFGDVEGEALEARVHLLKREVNIMKSLKHPRIVRYLGADRRNNEFLIFMEYVPGGSLAAVISEFGRPGLALELAAGYTKQILEGLCYLHSQNVIHRDMKAANVLIDPVGVVKLADLGAAQHQDTVQSRMQGTYNWMAPEVIREDTGCIGWQSDIWSMACTVIEMLTGDVPFHEVGPPFMVMAYIGDESNDIELPAEVTDPIALDFLSICLRRDFTLRPTAEALLDHPFIVNYAVTELPAGRPDIASDSDTEFEVQTADPTAEV